MCRMKLLTIGEFLCYRPENIAESVHGVVDVAKVEGAAFVIAPTLNTTAAFHVSSVEVAVVVPVFAGFVVLSESEVMEVL